MIKLKTFKELIIFPNGLQNAPCLINDFSQHLS